LSFENSRRFRGREPQTNLLGKLRCFLAGMSGDYGAGVFLDNKIGPGIAVPNLAGPWKQAGFNISPELRLASRRYLPLLEVLPIPKLNLHF
jgi:hypothetical protein